jgi:hypothetical protein
MNAATEIVVNGEQGLNLATKAFNVMDKLGTALVTPVYDR